MKENWKEEIINSLVTASILRAGQSISVLRSVAGADSHFEYRKVSSYISTIAYYTSCTKVWSLRRDPINGKAIIPEAKYRKNNSQ